MPKIRKKFITTGINESYYNIINNIEDVFAHQKINDDSNPSSLLLKSGVLASSKGKYLKRFNSEPGTLPSVLQTTGKTLQSYNDPFNETNILEYKSELSNSNVGIPLITLTELNTETNQQVNVGHYMTTNNDLLLNGTISKGDSHYISKYDLTNSKVFDSPNSFDNHIKHADLPETVKRQIKPDIDEILLSQKRFEEQYQPYKEDFSNFIIPEKNDEFYYNTIDEEILENYNLGRQREIKIVLDFSSNSSVDLTLLNTKMTFNLPNEGTNSYTEDDLVSTKYINFTEGEQSKNSSYSSHFLPTAYWNFEKNRWNYLDGNLLDFDEDQESSLNLSDFPVENSGDIKYSYLGAKNNTGSSTTISPNFIYNGSSLQSQEIYDKNLKNNVLSVYNKPILTTPGFRPDGSTNANNTSGIYNKTGLSKITNTYGFPYKQNWQPTKDQLLNLSNYIANDFLLEKISIKGTFTSQGEMPNKKGNFSSGYRQSGQSNELDSTTFNETYDYKDNFEDYITNSLTFFILNERKGFNHISQKINAEPLQSYFLTKKLYLTQPLDYYNTKGKKLDSYLGNYSSYEIYQNTLNVYSQIIPNTFIYNIDEYNNVELNSSYLLTSNNIQVKNNNRQNIFHFLENISDSSTNDNTIIDSVYFKNNIDWITDYDLNVLDNTHKKYNIKLEDTEIVNQLGSTISTDINNFNNNTGRELVTYSNFLIAGKKSNIDLDNQVLLNIDEKKIVNFETEEVNINITDKEEFKINSHVKNSYQSDYIDESIYKIKSNFKENVIFEQEQLSNLNITFFNENLLSGIINGPGGGIPLFEFSNGGEIDSALDRILGYPNSEYPDNYGIPTTVYNNLSEISSIDNKISTGDSTCTYLNSKLDFKILDKTDGQIKDSSLLIFYSYQNNAAVNNLGHLSNNKNAMPDELLLKDFIVYDTIEFDGDLCTKATLNLRFLDPFLTSGISEEFFALGFEGSGSEGLFYDPSMLIDDVFEEYEFKLTEEDDSLWISTRKQYRLANFMKFFLISILNAPLYDKSSSLSTAQVINKLYKYIPQFPDNSNNLIAISGEGVININFFESLFNPYTNNNEDLNLNFYTINDTNSPHIGSYLNLNNAFKTFYNFSSDNRGASELSFEEEYYNYNNVLEGKSAGGPNNLGVSSERLFIRKKDKNTKSILNPVKTISGKEIKSAGSLNFSENSNYLLKPEDRLVFGVSSNCNGEVAPTVVTLHDKLEITLIGRDYITNTKHKTNECKSIRKVVTGDNNTQRLGSSIYQTVGSYFDSVWSKNNSANNLKDFGTKSEVAKNSSRDFGTYTGVISFDKTFNTNNEVVYQADTVQPSLAKVYLSEDCLNKKQLYSIDSRDRYQFNKKRNNSLFKLPSYKMIFSDNISQENLTNYPNRYSKVETNWHSTFHMQKYKEFFQNSQNKKVVDYSYNNALREKQDDKSNYFIHYDINSYSAGINYESPNSLKKKYIENKNKELISSGIPLQSGPIDPNNPTNNTNQVSASADVNKLPRLYKSLKTYMLPFSKHKVFQNALNIANNSYTRKDKYIKNDKLIEKNVSNTEVFDIPSYSIQYMLHDIEPEYCDISDDVKYQLFGENNTEYSSSWCIVLKVSQIQFNSLRSKLSNDDLSLFDSDIKTINLTSPGATVTYYNHNIFLNISEKASDFENFEDIDLAKTVTKKFKFITKIYDNEATNPSEYYLVSPLHFWETSETNTLQTSQTNIFDLEVNSSTTSSSIGFGRKNSQFNISNKDSLPTSAWYAKLDNYNTLLDLAEASDVYENFLILTSLQSHENTSIYPPESLTRKISITGIETTQSLGNFSPIAGTISADTLFVPFTNTELDELSESARALIINKSMLITYAGFNLSDMDKNIANTNVYSELSTLNSFLSNNFILNKTKKYLISNEYFANQIRLLQEKEKNSLTLVDENDLSYNINEKIYLSNCKNVISNQYFDTNSNFVYKVKENYIEGNNENNQESYKIIELKGIINSFTIFKKNKILEEDLLFEFDDNSKLRVYEEKLLKDVSTYSITSNFNTPYFEIDLSSNLQREYSLPENIGENIKEIPYAHYSLDYAFSPETVDTGLNVEIQDVQETDVFNTDIDNISSGSPIFMLSENPDGYENKIEQEEKIKEFLYGFSRGKYRYPIKRLDGFKYGVECGSKKSFNYHFKNNSYGQFSDKIMGSTNYATARLDRQGNTVFDRAVEKRFVNEYFEFVDINDYEANIRNNEDVYNKDRFCRSYYPYIENVNDDLSQLNSNNSYFNESNAF